MLYIVGIWRMQSLPNCSPDGTDACRLTYAVELRPKGFLPVKLIEGRIAMDLRQNIGAIRRHVENRKRMRQQQQLTVDMVSTGLVPAVTELKNDEISRATSSSTLETIADGSTRELLKAVLSTIKSNNVVPNVSASSSSISSTSVVTETDNVGVSQDLTSESITKSLSISGNNETAVTANVTRFSFRRYFGLTKLLGEPQDSVPSRASRSGDNDDSGTSIYSSDWSNTKGSADSDKLEKMSVDELKEAYMKLKLENSKLKNQIIKQEVMQLKNDELSE